MTSLIIETPKTTGGLIYHSSPRRQSEDIRHHLSLGPRRQSEATFKSPKTTGGLFYHSSL
ncbi:hypothetical protein H5410_022616 [Solanum commersonii]|uniref:Uncharacterized protein n=1 Tax=Solanum commersonii TaxID=4109 RepID=A0A9J5ZHB2_SOLCO|nr:hypothetical protein H5410_022616 [Solanum commersonii]